MSVYLNSSKKLNLMSYSYCGLVPLLIPDINGLHYLEQSLICYWLRLVYLKTDICLFCFLYLLIVQVIIYQIANYLISQITWNFMQIYFLNDCVKLQSDLDCFITWFKILGLTILTSVVSWCIVDFKFL